MTDLCHFHDFRPIGRSSSPAAEPFPAIKSPLHNAATEIICRDSRPRLSAAKHTKQARDVSLLLESRAAGK